MKNINTLVSDIEKLFKGRDLSKVIETFGSPLEDVLVRRFKEYSEKREQSLRISNIGKPLRQLYYTLNNFEPDEELPVNVRIKFLFGDLLEQMLLFLAVEAGHDVSGLQQEVVVDGVVGHIDCLLDGYVVDVKSASTFSFKKFLNREIVNDDPFGYMWQLAGYSRALGLPGAFLVIDKTLGNICLVPFTQEELVAYDVPGRIKTIREVKKAKEPPERCYSLVPEGKSGNLKIPIGCSNCSYKYRCYSDANNGEGLKTYSYSKGLVHLAVVKKEPRVQAVDQEEFTE